MTTSPASGALPADKIKAARDILHRLCQEGHLRMSVPVREDSDEDFILSDVINAAALASREAADDLPDVPNTFKEPGESDEAWLNRITGAAALASPQVAPAPEPESMLKEVEAALVFALWHHQGGSSKVGQPIRQMLGIGPHMRLNAGQIDQAKRVQAAFDVANYGSAAPVQVAPALTEAETIMSVLAGGGWELHRVPAWDALTDEANREQAWCVKRTEPPFCSQEGDRQWSGPTAFKAFERAFAALKMKIATPVQVAPQDDARDAAEVLTDEQITRAWNAMQERLIREKAALRAARIGSTCAMCGKGKLFLDGNGYYEFERCDACRHVPLWDADGKDAHAALSTPAAKPTEEPES